MIFCLSSTIISRISSRILSVCVNFDISEGWNPKLENPECPIEETIFSQDESCTLNYNACMLLKHLGDEYDEECKNSLTALSQRLVEVSIHSLVTVIFLV